MFREKKNTCRKTHVSMVEGTQIMAQLWFLGLDGATTIRVTLRVTEDSKG